MLVVFDRQPPNGFSEAFTGRKLLHLGDGSNPLVNDSLDSAVEYSLAQTTKHRTQTLSQSVGQLLNRFSTGWYRAYYA
jgi:hypothetical protein